METIKSEINRHKLIILKLIWTCLFLQEVEFNVDNDTIYHRIFEEDIPKTYMFIPNKIIPVWYECYNNYNKKQKLSQQKVKDILSKSLKTNTTLKCKLSSLYLLNCNIDWKVFSQANITLYGTNGRRTLSEFRYNLKDLPCGFNSILKTYTNYRCYLELMLPLDINYMVTKTNFFAFVMGTHKRLGSESSVSLLDTDILPLILSYY